MLKNRWLRTAAGLLVGVTIGVVLTCAFTLVYLRAVQPVIDLGGRIKVPGLGSTPKTR